MLSLFRRLCRTHEGVKSISIFGELFGGAYPHPDVQRVGRLTVIQKGVFYTPKHEFYGFDIYVFTENGGSYLSVDEANALFESEGFFYAKVCFPGLWMSALSIQISSNPRFPSGWDCLQ